MTPAKKAAPRKQAPRKRAVLPGDEAYDWGKDYPDEEVFTYPLSTGKVVGLAAISEARRFTVGEIRRSTHMNEVQQVFQMLEKHASPNALTLVDALVDTEFKDMMEAWTAWNNTALGES